MKRSGVPHFFHARKERKKIEIFLSYKIMSLNPPPMSLINEPSICIPRALANVSWFQVKDTFEQIMGKGTVERVDIVSKNNGDNQPFCRIFVHFRYWPNTADMISLRKRLIAGETIKIVYDNPWFWKCAVSRIPKPERSTPRSPPYILFDGNSEPTASLPVTTQTDNEESPLPPRRSGLKPLEVVHSGAPEPDHPVVETFSDS